MGGRLSANSRRSSLASSRRSSHASRTSRNSAGSTHKRELCFYCTIGHVDARVRFWPVERLDSTMPNFPSSQMASTGYVVLVPIDSSNLEIECDTLRQRLDEVRFFAHRANAKMGHR